MENSKKSKDAAAIEKALKRKLAESKARGLDESGITSDEQWEADRIAYISSLRNYP